MTEKEEKEAYVFDWYRKVIYNWLLYVFSP